jgi:hypothetical protein
MNITDKINELNKKLFIDLQEASSGGTGELEIVGEKVEGLINTWGKDLAEATKMECDPPKFKVKIDIGSDQPLMIEPANDVAKEIFDINDVLGLQRDS